MRSPIPPVKCSGLIIGERRVWCNAPVTNMFDHGLDVRIGHGARRRFPRDTPIDLFVLHWTGGEGTGPGLFRVLNARELGVEFAVDRQGLIWQYADPLLVDTFDAGPVNRRSVGVEVVNYGFRRRGQKVPRKGQDRPVYSTRLNRRARTFARFYPAQVASVISLVDACCTAIPTIPRRIPRIPGATDDTTTTPMGVPWQHVDRVMTDTELDAYKGVIGHYHITKRKSDPGTEIFRALAACGY